MFTKKILLVDDDKEIIEKLKLPLMVREYDILEAYDGLQALEMIRKNLPDLVVMDILMPKLDGLKVTRLFKFDERYKHIPVIAVSHAARSEDEQFLKGLGINQMFMKPVDPENVVASIERLLNRNAT